MTYVINCRKTINKSRNILVLLLMLTTHAGISLHSQVSVALPLNNYANNGTQKLTPAIIVPEIQFQSPEVSFAPALPAWLDFAGASLGNGTYKIELFVKAGQCPTRPVAQSDCGGACAADLLTDFTTATVNECQVYTVTAFGQGTPFHLCIYGDPKLTINQSVLDFNLQVGHPTDKILTINRKGPVKLTITPDTVGTGLTIDQTTLPAIKVLYNPKVANVGGTNFTLTVSGVNPNNTNLAVCDPPVQTTITVKATDVPVGGKVDLVMVLDVSGSMGDKGACMPDANAIYNPSGFGSKLDFVKKNLRTVYAKIAPLVPAGSRIGIVTFADNAEEKKIGGNFFNDFTLVNESSVSAIIDGLSPTTSTNMGGGLNQAIQELKTSSAVKKQIVLITNGMQNGNQLVRIKNNTAYIDLNDNSSIDAGETIPDDIQIFTIAIFQPSAEYLDLLKAISKSDSRFNDVCTMNKSIDEAFAHSYSINSPKLLGTRRGNFSGNTATINYSVTETEFDKIVTSVSSSQNTNITYTFEKNVGGSWKDITSGGTLRQVAQGSTIFSIGGLPKVVNGVTVTPDGDYRILANSSVSGVDYYSSLILDDHGLKDATFVESNTFRAGDGIILSVRMRNDVTPVHQPNLDVKAVIHRPVLSFEKLMAKENVPSDKVISSPLDRENKRTSIFKKFSLKPADGAAFEVGLPLIDQKYQVIVYQNGFLGRLFYLTDTIPLPEITNGVYQAKYSNTKITGMYTVEYLINGNVPVIGKFFRTASHSTPVLFGTPDRSKSDFYLFDEAGSYFLSLRPEDIYDNYLGMGKAEQIKMTMTIGSHSQILDYLNGRYVIPLNVPVNQNPYVVITIAGMEFYRGYLFNIPQKRFFIGIQAGVTTPMGNFKNVADPGFMAGLKFGYRFNRKFGVLAEGGYFSFKDATHISKNPNIFGGAVGLSYIPTSLPISTGIIVQLEGTVGYYKPTNISGKIGFRGGLDLSKYFRTWFSMSLNSSYYRIQTKPDPVEFLGISLMAKFHF